jgi:6-pyruvoyltetrahydropterin/6-carboxytetrahydropterin synthase
VELCKEFLFEASHILPKHPGKCSRLHGHSWVLRVYVKGPINPDTGFVQDFADISAAVKPLIDDLDHHHLGAWHPANLPYNHDWGVAHFPANMYPSSENLLVWVGQELNLNLNWSKLELEETCTSAAILLREEFDAIQ